MTRLLSPPKGTSITELVVAMVLLTSATSLIGTALPCLARQRQLTFQSDVAREEARQQLDRLTRLESNERVKAMAALRLSAAAARQLPGAELRGALVENDPRMGPGALAIQVRITWRSGLGGTRTSMLETWVFP